MALAAVLLFANTLSFDYALDDFSVIKANRLTRQGWDAFPQIVTTPYRYGYYFTQDDLYRPIPKAMFAIEWAVSPDNPALGHFINVILYGLTGLLLFFTLSTYLKDNLIVAFTASLLFVAHPIHTEVVANIKSRDEILGFLFLLLALNFLHGVITGARRTLGVASGVWSAVLMMAAFLLALLSKESAVTFLAVFPLAIYCFTDTPVARNLRTSALMLVPVAVFLVLRYNVLSHNLPSAIGIADNLLGAAHTGAERFATAVSILGIYLKLMFVPHPLVFDRSYNDIPIVGLTAWPFLASLLVQIALAAFALLRIGKKDGIAFAILCYFITLSISSNVLFLIGTSYGERLTYLPSLGFCLAMAFLLEKVFRRTNGLASETAGAFARKHATTLAVVGVIVVLFAVKTETRNVVWRNNETLFSHDVTLAPNSARIHYLLGNQLSNPDEVAKKDPAVRGATLETAIAELKRSAEIYPDFAETYNQLGVAYYQKKNLDEALKSYTKALEHNPGNATYHSNLGLVYFARNDLPGALKAFQEAVALDPNYTEGLANLGIVYGMAKDYDHAIEYLLRCVRTSPDYVRAYYFLSGAYDLKGDKASAEFYMSKYRALGGRMEAPKSQNPSLPVDR